MPLQYAIDLLTGFAASCNRNGLANHFWDKLDELLEQTELYRTVDVSDCNKVAAGSHYFTFFLSQCNQHGMTHES